MFHMHAHVGAPALVLVILAVLVIWALCRRGSDREESQSK